MREYPFAYMHNACGGPAFLLTHRVNPEDQVDHRFSAHLDGTPTQPTDRIVCGTCGSFNVLSTPYTIERMFGSYTMSQLEKTYHDLEEAGLKCTEELEMIACIRDTDTPIIIEQAKIIDLSKMTPDQQRQFVDGIEELLHQEKIND